MNTRAKVRMGVTGGARRQGFTLVELMVSVMMLSVGLLGLVSSSAAVAQMVGKAGRQSVASRVAETRFEKLRSSDCTAVTGGSDAARPGIQESWIVQRMPRAVIVTDSVRYSDRGVARSFAFQSVIPCPSLP
jgi:prepilin-type N-terminal cleavage/methylation domain-containing protein